MPDIPAEAVDAAAINLQNLWGDPRFEFDELDEVERESWRSTALEVLAAARPSLRAQWLAEAHDVLLAEATRLKSMDVVEAADHLRDVLQRQAQQIIDERAARKMPEE
jgi:hypothetical protein